MIEDRREYPLGNVKEAEIELLVRQGSLAVHGGASELCVANFEYSHPELRPEDDYDEDGDEARLAITQPRTEGPRDTRSAWNIQLNGEAQIDLGLSSMSGGVSLDLDRVNVGNLEVESMSGSVRASLGGNYPALDEISIESASGSVAVRLSGAFPELTSIQLDSKSGKVDLVVSGECPNLRRIGVDCKSGTVDLDLRGHFEREDLGVRVDSISGGIRVRVPGDVGVSMNAKTVSGRVRADGFNQDGGRWTNDAFGNTVASLWLNLHAISGGVDVASE
ncbi:MAG: toast rack family protein [Thermomicrobiales bacterium]